MLWIKYQYQSYFWEHTYTRIIRGTFETDSTVSAGTRLSHRGFFVIVTRNLKHCKSFNLEFPNSCYLELQQNVCIILWFTFKHPQHLIPFYFFLIHSLLCSLIIFQSLLFLFRCNLNLLSICTLVTGFVLINKCSDFWITEKDSQWVCLITILIPW